MSKVATRYLEVDPWVVEEKGFHPKRSLVSESIFSVSNEYMGARGYFEEGYSGQTMQGCYFNGVYEYGAYTYPELFEGFVTRTHFMVNALDWLWTRVRLDGETLDLATSKFKNFSRRLDLRRGVTTRSFVWTTAKGKQLKLTFIRFTSMAQAELGAQRIVFEPLNFSGPVQVQAGLNFDIGQYSMDGQRLWRVLNKGEEAPFTGILGTTRESGQYLASLMRLECSSKISPKHIESEAFSGQAFAVRVKEGQATTLDRLVVNVTEKRPETPQEQVCQKTFELARKLQTVSFEEALAAHEAIWEKIWDELDITIDGDPANQQGIRFCIAQLHQAYHGVDPSLNISAKGLTGEMYGGFTWWDTETYCLPFYIFNNPKAARNLLGYRYNSLPQAMERARQKDCRGARYPMCTINGAEACGVWQHGDLEIHVSSAVGYGIMNYHHLTRDDRFLFTEGAEMLVQICRYYASRGAYSQKTGEFGLWGVMGPDEFHMMVHNNAYTNNLAKKIFEYTVALLGRMKQEAPKALAHVSKKVKLEAGELNEWAEKGAKMRTNFDPKSGLFEQHDGFFDLPHLDCKTIDPKDFPLYRHWAYTRIFRWDMLKQPDAVFYQFLFSEDFSPESKRANFDYYEPRCSHESSLSPGIHSIVAAELGRHEMAYQYFGQATRLDLDDYNRNANQGLHTTSMAAAWMNIIYGFGGMRTGGETLAFRPTLPKQWTGFSFRIRYMDSILSVAVDKKNVTLKVTQGEPIEVELYGQRVAVTPEGVKAALPKACKA